MKENKLLLATMALPLFMAACSSEDLVTEVQGNDPYPGVEKVDASFGFETGTESRLANKWELENNDVVGLAWLGDETNIQINGNAYQNHPLYAVGEGENAILKPKTSIYVGEYFSYAPYDYATKSIGKINFSVAEQTLMADVNESGKNAAAAKSIWISPKWTNVIVGGYKDAQRETWNDAGVDKNFKMYPRKFSNLVRMELGYVNNILANAETPDIKKIVVSYLDENKTEVSNKTFTYAPTKAASTDEEVGKYYWNGKKIDEKGNGVDATKGNVTLTGEVLADGSGDTFYFNALPAAENKAQYVKLVMTTTYGVVTIEKPLSEIAKTYVQDDTKDEGYNEYYYDGQKNSTNQKLLGVAVENSFVNNLGNNGRLIANVDFLTAVMDGMHVTDDTELQKMLNYYKNYKKNTTKYSETKQGTDIKLLLDGNNSGRFEMSTTSVALIREINKNCADGGLFVSVMPCTGEHYCSTIYVVGGGEVPALDKVFESTIDNVTLGEQSWTWNETPVHNNDLNNQLTGKNFGNVKKLWLHSNGTLTIGASNIKAVGTLFEEFMNSGKIVVKSEANVKFNLLNMGSGKITINKNASLLAYGSKIINDANENNAGTDRAYKHEGEIDNYGVLGVVAGTKGRIENYAIINNREGARTYITTNQTSTASFANAFNHSSNMIGTINLTTPFDNISVSNATTQGLIKYTWPNEGKYVTPTPVNDVKYNYLILNKNIEFDEAEPEIKYLEVAENAKIVLTALKEDQVWTDAQRLEGFVLKSNAEVDIKKGNLVSTKAAYLKGKMYLGGQFWYNNDLETYIYGKDTDVNNIIQY